MNKINIIDFILSHIKSNKRISTLYTNKHPNTKYSIESIIEDIIYVLKTGISWRSIRSNNNWQSIYFHFKRFVKYKIFRSLFNNIKNRYILANNINTLIIDSSYVPNKNGKQSISRNKFYKNKNGNKITIITDIKGIPLTAFVSKGTINDCKLFNPTYRNITKKVKNSSSYLLADKGYISRYIREKLAKNNCVLMVPHKKGQKKKHFFDKKLYKKRIVVEQTFQKIKVFRRLHNRYDSNIYSFYGFSYLAMSLIIYRAI